MGKRGGRGDGWLMDGWMDAEGMEDGGDVRLRKWGCVEGCHILEWMNLMERCHLLSLPQPSRTAHLFTDIVADGRPGRVS